MKKNTNPIYCIMVFEKLPTLDDIWDSGSSRIVGYYHDKNDAINAVIHNNCDIRECLYDYALIEEVEPGLYNPSFNRFFYKYQKEIDQYIEIPEPESVKHLCGFTIG